MFHWSHLNFMKLTSIVSAVIEIFLRTTVLLRERLSDWILFKRRWTNDRTPEFRNFMRVQISSFILADFVGLWLAPIIVLFYYRQKYGFNFGYDLLGPPNLQLLGTNVLIQFLILTATNLICLAYEETQFEVSFQMRKLLK